MYQNRSAKAVFVFADKRIQDYVRSGNCRKVCIRADSVSPPQHGKSVLFLVISLVQETASRTSYRKCVSYRYFSTLETKRHYINGFCKLKLPYQTFLMDSSQGAWYMRPSCHRACHVGWWCKEVFPSFHRMKMDRYFE
ncbi:hypothetical protein AVEN_190243-1 [Araneus ventricosus]|uniref:Uncharacterized protein n=1 Tax=Araneus ventricosus TaxID=182803 RepID=A0A4Y2M3D7_ARAVE|nr:hypothetical protein AVEN_190243-1 [Araneus ventricosus]